jgi:uncharacterized protein YndB with AHSA1/START domain
MPLKKDGDRREVAIEALLPGTPEQVWNAVATADGTAAWFTRMEIEPRPGGKLAIDFGDGVSTTGEVVEWDPPRKFVYVEKDWAPGAPDCFTEITIHSRSGDRCVMRMVHTLFTSSDDWDDQLEGFEGGWPAFIEVLRLYLPSFSGQPARSFMARAESKRDQLATWTDLTGALGLSGANVGERRGLTGGPERVEAVVEGVHQGRDSRYLILRIEGASPGAMIVGTHAATGSASASICRFSYGPDADASLASAEPAWRDWMTREVAAGD